MNTHSSSAQSIPVYCADTFRVSTGANLGDGMSVCDELMPDDVYTLQTGAVRERMSILALADGTFRIAADTEIGAPGAALHLDCALILMSPDGQNTDAIVLVEVDRDGDIVDIYLLPLAPLVEKNNYTLVGIDRDAARQKFAQVACVSFTRGTHITMASGAQILIEDLQVGDRILTRDDGPQKVRWIGQSTVRATGDFAPIVVSAGTLNNSNDLTISPDHRLFVYQRTDQIGAGQSELLLKARHLVNGDSVYVQSGGFVDYFQILFDRHHIIYAEGIAAESMLVDSRTRPALPPEMLQKLNGVPDHARRDSHGLDVQKALLDRPDAIELLRRASME
ncbi:MAG: Hint domain-containing protein [Rhodobacteraceae bacterium]|nr:Hint domain-containing protein [Paracoccaceae bacterium]